MNISFSNIPGRLLQFAEKQGFPLIVTVCVAVITASALWTGRNEAAYVSPTPPVVRDISAAQLMQESIRNAATPSPSPTTAPEKWIPPLKDLHILRPFDDQHMQQSGVTGVWRIHTGTDLAASKGEPIYAMARGEILENGQDDLQGVWFRIDHSGIVVLYAGMIAAGDFLAGDVVEAGDTLGFAGNCLLEESDLGPHLHLEAMQNGELIDPTCLWGDVPAP